MGFQVASSLPRAVGPFKVSIPRTIASRHEQALTVHNRTDEQNGVTRSLNRGCAIHAMLLLLSAYMPRIETQDVLDPRMRAMFIVTDKYHAVFVGHWTRNDSETGHVDLVELICLQQRCIDIVDNVPLLRLPEVTILPRLHLVAPAARDGLIDNAWKVSHEAGRGW